MTVYGSNTRVEAKVVAQRIRECYGRLCVVRNGQSCKTRQFTVLSGFGPDHNMGVYNNSVDTIERSLTERYFLCKVGNTFRPAYRVRNSSFRTKGLQDFQKSVLAYMPHLPQMTRSQAVESYRGPKYKVYSAAARSLAEECITSADALLKMFTKFEKVDVGKAPRNINPRDARYNLELARYLKHAEHHYFKAINRAFGKRTAATVIKGVNADRAADILRDKWDQFIDPVAIGLDARKFDMHVSVQALKYEHQFYKLLFPRSRKLRKLLRWQLRNRGTAYVADGMVKFDIEGTRSSGDINTSLGNCLLMCAMIWEYARERGVDIELANNGDDCVVIMESSDLAQFQNGLTAWFKTKGFDMEVEAPVYEFEQIEFCQTHPVKLESGWRMVRNLKAVLEKDPICLLPIPNTKILRRWLDAVGTCGGTLCSGVPVLESFYAAMKRHGSPHDGLIREVYRGRSQLQLGAGCKVGNAITNCARVSFYYAFGVTPDQQLALERYYATLTLDLEALPQGIEREHLVLNPGFNILEQSSF